MAKKEIFQLSKKYKNGIRINFSEIFHQNLDEYEDFDLSTKKTYSNNVEFFCQENNNIIELDQNNEILTNYLMVKYNIDKQKYKQPEEFIQTVAYEIFKPWFVDKIEEYVSKKYVELCEDINKNLHNNDGKLNPSLVFTNEHAIIIYNIAVMFRFISPLATQFMMQYSDMISSQEIDSIYTYQNGERFGSFSEAMNNGKMFIKTAFLVSLMKEIINIATYKTPEINIYGKLNHYTLSLIKGTSYSDAEMWNKLAMRSTSKYSLTDVIMAKLLIDIIPKATFHKSIIKFIVTTIEQHITWNLHQKFNISYNVISSVSENSDFSDADKFEINSVKSNELKKIITDNFMDDSIDIIFKRRNFILDPDEYNYYLNNNDNVYSIQDNMIRNFFAKSFGCLGNLDGLSKLQYPKLLCYLIHFLEDGCKFKILPYILTGKIITMNKNRLINKPIERKIKDSLRYQRIIEKYSNTGDALNRAKTIETNIVTILNSSIAYNKYGCEKNGEIIEFDTSELCDEYLKFIEML